MQEAQRTVLITGSAAGLGAAMARDLAAAGYRLVLADIRKDLLDRVKTEVEDLGGTALAIEADVSKEDSVERLFAECQAQEFQPDVVVNNAGILRDGLLVKAKDGEIISRLSLEAWSAVIGVNLTGVFLCARAAAESMIQNRKQGVIINISSISRHGNMGQTNYTAAKAGVAAMTVTWARELARHGIRVASISPGFIATDMVASMKPEILEKITGTIPAGRMGKPEEIAHTVRFIIENEYISGRDFGIDGGQRL